MSNCYELIIFSLRKALPLPGVQIVAITCMPYIIAACVPSDSGLKCSAQALLSKTKLIIK